MRKRLFAMGLLLLVIWTVSACESKGTETAKPQIREVKRIVTVAPEKETTEPEPEPLPWNLLLVNPWNAIPGDYEMELVELGNGQAVDSRVNPDLQEMLDTMRSQGLRPWICSSYRTDEKQQKLYSNKVHYYLDQGYSLVVAEQEAGKWVAVPGTSEHQTGMALDIVDINYQMLDEAQANTPAQRWLMEHSWEYGFILRYPSDKTDITGIYYEPWHYRYVGREAAEAIHSQGFCLEEYLEQKEAAQ